MNSMEYFVMVMLPIALMLAQVLAWMGVASALFALADYFRRH